jgi:hypothetical protein
MQRWDDPEYREKMINLRTGAKNNFFTNARKDGVCVICGTCFRYYASNRSEGKYCSIPCASKSVERAQKLRLANIGKKASPETRLKLSIVHIGLQVGEKSGTWKGGISKIGQALRTSPEYARWRRGVFERDNFTCQLCGVRGGRLIADHYPYPFAKYPEHRLNPDNGRALCQSCDYQVTYVTKEWQNA